MIKVLKTIIGEKNERKNYYLMIVGTEKPKFAANERVIDETRGCFEMRGGGASGNSYITIGKENAVNASKTLKRGFFFLFAVAILFLTAGSTLAQEDSMTTPKKRLKSPAIVKGFVGGEAHDSYVIRVRKNQTLRVQISWKRPGDHTAQFVVSRSADFFTGELVEGKETYGGRSWVGKILATGDYYIYVTAYPTANYTLKVTVK